MNERIRELAEQAGLKHHNWITNESNVKDGDFTYPRLEDYEKFAELIVRECMKVVNNGRFGVIECEGNSHRVSYNNGIYYALSSVKKHFGVEE